MCVHYFSFNYYGFYGFLFLFYCSSQDDGLFPVALKGLLLPFHSREHLVSAAFCLTPVRICRLFHCSLSFFFQLLFLMLYVFFMCMGCSFGYLLIEIACLFHCSLIFFSFGVFKVSIFSSSSWFYWILHIFCKVVFFSFHLKLF